MNRHYSSQNQFITWRANKRHKFPEFARETHFKHALAEKQNRCIIECDFLINILIILRANKLLLSPPPACKFSRSFKCLPRHGGIKLLWRLLESSWHAANIYISRWHHMMAHSRRKAAKNITRTYYYFVCAWNVVF